MNDLLAGLFGLLLATNQAVAASNLLKNTTGISVAVPNQSDPVEREFQRLMADDDAAQEEVDRWIIENHKLRQQEAGVEEAVLNKRIEARLGEVRKAYVDFLRRHPGHSGAHLAYGSFLNDIGEEHAAKEQWEKARQLDPKDPAAWNNLANYFGHNSPVTKSFEYYEKAIELDPAEPLYYQNLATTVYLFRKDATNYYGITEPQVFEKAMKLYFKALELDPTNFLLASDLAQSYYGIKLPEGDEEARQKAKKELAEQATEAWQVAMKLARDDTERQGVYIHLARNQINAGQFEAARRSLNAVTNEMLSTTRLTLFKKLASEEAAGNQ